MATDLLTAATADGDGSTETFPGGVGTIHLDGTFNGRESVVVSARPTGKTIFKQVMVLHSGDSNKPHNFQLEGGHDIKANLQGAGVNPDIPGGRQISSSVNCYIA